MSDEIGRPERPRPLSDVAVWDRIDPLAEANSPTSLSGLRGLPFGELSSRDFERLCYDILVADGQNPRFFGRPGQPDLGVDIVVESGGSLTVYQCKNLAAAPRWTQIRKAVERFEAEWLVTLPRPTKYVYCCPQPLDDTWLGIEWITFRQTMLGKGVELALQDIHLLNSKLRVMPDVVSSVFGATYAEHFCGRDTWRDDPWVQVRRGEARHASVRRFLDQHARDAICIASEEATRFDDMLDQSPAVVVRGLPGSGKTTTTLALAAQLRSPARRLYYGSMHDCLDLQHLWQSAARRISLPSLFVLDDCHLALDRAGDLLVRLDPELTNSNGFMKLLLIVRDLPGTSPDAVSDLPAWLTQFIAAGHVLDMVTSPSRTKAIALHRMPSWEGLSEARVARLHTVTGGNLLLLDEVLNAVGAPHELDGFDQNDLIPTVREHYFGGNRRLPTVEKLACLAQFDLAPVASFVTDWQPGEYQLTSSVMTEVFGPRRYHFVHSSLAQLIHRSLVALDTSASHLDHEIEARTGQTALAYCEHLFATCPDEPAEVSRTISALASHARIQTGERAVTAAQVLASPGVVTYLSDRADRIGAGALRQCLQLLAEVGHPAKNQYSTLLRTRLLRNLTHGGNRNIAQSFAALALADPAALAQLEQEINPKQIGDWLVRYGTVLELFQILQFAPASLNRSIVEGLDHTIITALVQRTTHLERSLGAISFALRELGRSDPATLKRVEDKIGPETFAKLIMPNSTLIELFTILAHSTREFANVLLDQFDSEAVKTLVDRTISSGRPLSGITWASRLLHSHDIKLLERVEQRIGAAHVLRLFVTNGNAVRFMRMVQNSSESFAASLLMSTDTVSMNTLVDRAIADQQSIGVVGIILRDLGRLGSSKRTNFEGAIGASNMSRLIRATGTIPDLYHVVENSTPGFARALLAALDATAVDAVVDRTVASGRSIGAVSLVMRLIPDRALRRELENVVSVAGFHKVIAANGSMVDLLNVAAELRPDKAAELLESVNDDLIETLVQRTTKSPRSVHAVFYSLRRLQGATPTVDRFAHAVGVERWWDIMQGTGNLFTVSQLAATMDQVLRERFIGHSVTLSVADWTRMFSRTNFFSAYEFTRRDLDGYPPLAQERFIESLGIQAETLASQATWRELNSVRPTEFKGAEILEAAVRSRANAISVAGVRPSEFVEAVNAFAFCWRHRPDLHNDLIADLWCILPKPSEWPSGKELTLFRLVLETAYDEKMPRANVEMMNRSLTERLTNRTCEACQDWPLVLLIWNMASLEYERTTPRAFVGSVSDALIERLLDKLRGSVGVRGEGKDALAQCALAGLLLLVKPSIRSEVGRVIRPLSRQGSALLASCASQTFVPAVLSVSGVALLVNPAIAFDPQICALLLSKADAYQTRGPAIAQLCTRLRSRMSRGHGGL